MSLPGFAVGILPSTFMSMRYGARWWLGFITIAWGIISSCHALISNKTSFCVLRLFLGLAESAGSSAGGHVLAQFYPKSKRAIPFTVVIVSSMVSGIFAAPLAAGLMSLHGRGGLSGWQWLFIIEGVPSVILGISMMIWLPSEPLTAWMLTPHQREMLHQTVHETPEEAEAARQPLCLKQLLPLLWDAAKRPAIWFFVAVAFLWTLSFMSLYQWLPVLINNMLSGTALSGSTSSGMSAAAAKGAASSQQTREAILLSGIPPICGSVAMLVVAWHSDRVNEKNWHVAIPYVISGIVLTLFTPFYKISFAGGFAVLVISLTLSNCSQGVYSSRVVGCLDTRHVGIGLALYTAVCGILAGFSGPLITGAFVQKMGSFSLATVADGVMLIAAGLLMAGLACWEKWGGRRLGVRGAGGAAAVVGVTSDMQQMAYKQDV
eukprot:GHUV01035143.1.p1 GENE.GHUV01035143.1~~GHUV01035143.1.p1  ORF type:complete len:433 (+),score=47.34 GHUV01035143.1:803-2101(+)